MIRKHTFIISLALLSVFGLVIDARAQTNSFVNEVNAKELPSKNKAVNKVKKETGGQILDIKEQSLESGVNVWRVKFLKDGRIQFIDVLPQSLTE